jgi:hypothetical protein
MLFERGVPEAPDPELGYPPAELFLRSAVRRWRGDTMAWDFETDPEYRAHQ